MSAVASVTTEAIPSIRDELQRKAFEHLERLVVQLDRGEINEAMFDAGVRAIWACVSGLVDEWLIDTISEIRDKIDGSFYDRRQFMKKDDGELRVLWLTRKLGSGNLTLRGLRGTDSKDWNFDEDIYPSKEAKGMQDTITATLVTAGWRRAF